MIITSILIVLGICLLVFMTIWYILNTKTYDNSSKVRIISIDPYKIDRLKGAEITVCTLDNDGVWRVFLESAFPETDLETPVTVGEWTISNEDINYDLEPQETITFQTTIN
jgi:hypothetical protein